VDGTFALARDYRIERGQLIQCIDWVEKQCR
jgi:hypothetical protein